MKRRDFFRVAGVALLPFLVRWSERKPDSIAGKWDVSVLSDREAGHLIRQASQLPLIGESAVDYLIVGGGVAGVTAAYLLRNESMALFEISAQLGGSSSAHHYDTLRFAQGAHYDLAYPDQYGEEGLALLQELDLIFWDKSAGLWTFSDRDYLIPSQNQERCFEAGAWRSDVIGDDAEATAFYKILEPYYGQMPLPTRLIDPSYHALDQVDFQSWLRGHHPFSDAFIERVDYQMKDDWGAGAAKVSALAGVHYYTCRPYESQDIDLFSPPEGNYFFIERMLKDVSPQKIRARHLVHNILPTEQGKFLVSVIDIDKKGIRQIEAGAVIYAGQKHAFKHVLKSSTAPLPDQEYAPWAVVNLVVSKDAWEGTHWQNDLLNNHPEFLGFVDGSKQHGEHDEYKVLTAYFCFDSKDREKLINAEQDTQSLVGATLDYIEECTGISLHEQVKKAFVKVMGHAMPIPTPGTLTRGLSHSGYDKLALAGVDTGRLPLFFEALDSGIQAVKQVQSEPSDTVTNS